MGKWTRRAFVTAGVLAGGAVVFGVAVRPGNRAGKVRELIASSDEAVFNVWLKISPNNSVTAIVPHAEMGQGVHTTLAMMLADELDADWDQVKFIEAPAVKEYANYALGKGFVAGDIDFPEFLVDTVDGFFLTIMKAMDMQITGGSSSVPMTGQVGMRVAGAATRAVLLEAAAESWGVPTADLVVRKGLITHTGSSRSATFAEFAQRAAELDLPVKPRLKSPGEYTIMGTDVQRFDIPAKVDGSAKFGIDAAPPGMKYATVKAAPVFGTTVKSIDESSVQEMPGLRKVINLGDAVAIVADGYWQAKKALDRLRVEFETGDNDSVEQSDIFNRFIADMDAATAEDDEITDLDIGDAK
ncbi:MAG: molybdopterin cofactor-binding domain-containing protein, partial [Woeseiaceae bacterium]